MDHLTYAEALLLINKQYRDGDIDFDLSCKLTNFCEQLHNLWKDKVGKQNENN